MPTINHQYIGAFAPGVYTPIFDPTGSLEANKVTDELHTITEENNKDYHVVVPLFAPFFINNLLITFKQNGTNNFIPLTEGVDYLLVYHFLGASRGCAKAIYGGISFINNQLAGIVKLQYQTIGGNWVLSLSSLNTLLANQIQNPRTTSWEQIIQLPELFPVIDHEWNLTDLIGARHLVDAIDRLSISITNKEITNNTELQTLILDSHLTDTSNPHQTTKEQIGLGNVENYKPSNTLQALDKTNDNTYITPLTANLILDSHLNNPDPHPDYISLEEVTSLINEEIDKKIVDTSDQMPTGYVNENGIKNKVFYLNDNRVTGNFIVPSNKNAMSAGPIEIDDGVTVELEQNSTWVIV